MKEYADRCSHAKNTDLSVGDKVLLKQPKQNKMSIPFKPEPFEIKDKKGSMVTAQNAERTVTRNASFFKKVPSSAPIQLIPSDDEEQPTPSSETADAAEGYHETDEAVEDEPETPPALRRSERTRRVPEHFKDYVTWTFLDWTDSLRKTICWVFVVLFLFIVTLTLLILRGRERCNVLYCVTSMRTRFLRVSVTSRITEVEVFH